MGTGNAVSLAYTCKATGRPRNSVLWLQGEATAERDRIAALFLYTAKAFGWNGSYGLGIPLKWSFYAKCSYIGWIGDGVGGQCRSAMRRQDRAIQE